MSLRGENRKEKAAELKTGIKLCEVGKKKTKFKAPRILTVFIILMLLGIGLFFLKPAITGFFILEQTNTYTDDINQSITETTETVWVPEQKGIIRSIKISGKLIGEGHASVTLITQNESFVLYNSSEKKDSGLPGITGFFVADDNESLSNETEQESLNETEPEAPQENITTENITRTITAQLVYADSDERWDLNNDGIETTAGVVDLELDNIFFSWDINEEELCTLWEVYSVDEQSSETVCYGNNECCGLVNIEPSPDSAWDDIFYSYYSRHGATFENTVSARIVYPDNEEEAGYVASDWEILDVVFEPETGRTISFSDECGEACYVSLESQEFRLLLEVEGAALTLDEITYSIRQKLENKEPVYISNITNITIISGQDYTLDMEDFFSDPEADELNYSITSTEHIDVLISDMEITITPHLNFTGTEFIVLMANDGYSTTIGEAIRIDVVEGVLAENVEPKIKAFKKDYKVYEEAEFEFEFLDKEELVRHNKWEEEYEVYEEVTEKTQEELVLLKEKIKQEQESLSEAEKLIKKQKKSFVKENTTIETFVYDGEGTLTDIEAEITEEREGKLRIKLANERQFRPGLYTLKVELTRDDITYTQEQNFTWGVLAINTHKSIYLENENAFIGIAVLDDGGRMVCNASVRLEIIDPSNNKTILSTENGLINISPECEFYGVTNLPDYYTDYTVNGVGTYVMNLTAVTFNGVRTISDNFSVQSEVDFDVARDGATRIFPAVPYTMNFTIKANKNHNGAIREYVPASFEITQQDGLTVTTVGDAKVLSWDIRLRQDDTINLAYEFDAPDTSPEFYLLGELEIGDWKEARYWQIASDAVSITDDGTMTANDTGMLVGETFTVTVQFDAGGAGIAEGNMYLEEGVNSAGGSDQASVTITESCAEANFGVVGRSFGCGDTDVTCTDGPNGYDINVVAVKAGADQTITFTLLVCAGATVENYDIGSRATQVQATVTFDDYIEGIVISAAANAQPTITSSPAITPQEPDTTNDLTCSFTIEDTDGGDTVWANVTWINGTDEVINQSKIITSGAPDSFVLNNVNTTGGENWNCSITPWDQKEYGTAESDNVTIQNTLPSILHAPFILPQEPNTTSVLNCSFTIEDYDVGDTLWANITWLNGEDQVLNYSKQITNGTNESFVLGIANTTGGENWNCSITPWDQIDYGAALSNNVTIQNTLPSILNPPLIEPQEPGTAKDLNCSFTIEDPDGGDTLWANITWLNGEDQVLNYSKQITNGTNESFVLGSANTTGGENWNCSITPWDQTDYGAALSNNVTIQNTAPSILNAPLISPQEPNTTSVLNCSFTIEDPDGGDTLWANVTWLNGDDQVLNYSKQITNGTNESFVLESANTTGGENWNCSITPWDQTDYGAALSNNVTIQNTAPSILNAPLISPQEPNTTSVLNCSFTIEDPDVGDTLWANITWLNGEDQVLNYSKQITNGTNESFVLGIANTTGGENWNCSITPWDQTDYGTALSNNVTIQNTAPSILNAPLISPQEPNTTSVLNCSFTIEDPDNANNLWANITWLNGTDQVLNYSKQITNGTNESFTLGIANTTSGENWNCSITPWDQIDYGAALSDNVTIQNTLPSILHAPFILPQEPNTTSVLNCSFTIEDPDVGDTLWANITWINGTDQVLNYSKQITNGTNESFVLSSKNTTAGENWNCTITPWDQTAYGINLSTNVTIQNTVPSILYAPLISPQEPNTTSVLNCSFTIEDPDGGDTLWANITWLNGEDQVLNYSKQITNGTNESFVLGIANTTGGENWNCSITPWDQTDYGTALSNNVTIQNTAPSILNAPLISPQEPNTTSVLNCSFTIEDPDNANNLWANITWLNGTDQVLNYSKQITNGTNESFTLGSANTTKGEHWNCTITPWDQTAYGTALSNNVTIQNTAPTQGQPFINSTDTLNRTNGTIQCWNQSLNDPDNDAMIVYYMWYKDGLPLGEEVSQTLSPSLFNKTSNITCETIVGDTFGNSTAQNSTTMLMNNTAPAINTTIPDRTVNYGDSWEFDVNASDFDVYDDVDTLIWSTNNTLIDIDSETGVISDTPTVSDVGAYIINISVDDETINDSQTFMYTVNDATPPITSLENPEQSHTNSTSTTYSIINFTCSATDAYNLRNISLYITNSSNESFSFNSSVDITGTSNSSNWSIELGPGNYTWNCLTYDQFNNSDWGVNRTLSINFTVTNVAPTITHLVTEQSVIPLDGTIAVLYVSFNVSDDDGFEDINVSSAKAVINRSGEVDRANSTCVQVFASGNEMQLNCSIIIWYFDANGTWSLNVSVSDNSTVQVFNASETVSVGVLNAIQIRSSTINFGGSVTAGQVNISAEDDPLVVNNTGNQNFVHINITAIDLAGITYNDRIIPAANFLVNITEDNYLGKPLINGTPVEIPESTLNAGNNTDANLSIYFWLREIPTGLSPQTHDTSTHGAWEIIAIT